TVGEKKRDWRRQRGDDPRTMRSTPSCRAASTIASPIERARTVLPTTTTPWSAPSAAASAMEAADVERLDSRPSLLCELDRGGDHLLADLTEFHRDEDLREHRLRREHLLVARHHVLEEAEAARAADEEVHDDASDEPGGAAVARAIVRDHRVHEDRRGRERADDRGHGDDGAFY